mmetsp:Transcript_80197/g.227049  ORF Transcript_80197/g.227049 Transcript_80197/m.227049 type:complete len:268 (+) Transcript_80197:1072-1875(+)
MGLLCRTPTPNANDTASNNAVASAHRRYRGAAHGMGALQLGQPTPEGGLQVPPGQLLPTELRPHDLRVPALAGRQGPLAGHGRPGLLLAHLAGRPQPLGPRARPGNQRQRREHRGELRDAGLRPRAVQGLRPALQHPHERGTPDVRGGRRLQLCLPVEVLLDADVHGWGGGWGDILLPFCTSCSTGRAPACRPGAGARPTKALGQGPSGSDPSSPMDHTGHSRGQRRRCWPGHRQQCVQRKQHADDRTHPADAVDSQGKERGSFLHG